MKYENEVECSSNGYYAHNSVSSECVCCPEGKDSAWEESDKHTSYDDGGEDDPSADGGPAADNLASEFDKK